MANDFGWICPQCGRTVPRRIGACRCGFVQETAPVPPPPLEPEPAKIATPAPRRTNTAIVAAAVVVAVAFVGAGTMVSLSLLKAGQKPVAQPAAATPTPAPAAEPEPALADPVPDVAELVATPPSDQEYSIEELVTRSMPAVVKVESAFSQGRRKPALLHEWTRDPLTRR